MTRHFRYYTVPFCVAVLSGCNRSLYSCKTSLSALQTLGDGEVVQSTSEGYSCITWFHTPLSTENTNTFRN